VSNVLVVHRSRTNIVTCNLGFDISTDTFTSQIRLEPDEDALLIATWAVEFTTDGTDGDLTLTLTDDDVDNIHVRRGWMDIKRDSGGLTLPVFDRPLEVEFRGVVTV